MDISSRGRLVDHIHFSHEVADEPQDEDAVLISVLLATYNWPRALVLSLQALKAQSDLDFEIVVADDGSTDETRRIVEQFQSDFPVPIRHLWQEDQGFRKSKILNQGIEQAQGEYLVFVDGDCIVQPDFISQHRRLSESNHLVTGSRILCDESLTSELISTGQWHGFSMGRVLRWRLRGKINKCLPLFIKVPDNRWRVYSQFQWRRIKGCNMACWKRDARSIGGFDEELVGWGHEDADFVFRLQNQHKVKRKSGAFATEVLHLWHPVGDRSQARKNEAIVRAKILAKG